MTKDETTNALAVNVERLVRLRAYMVFSRSGGPGEGACLVFAHSAKEARTLGHTIVSNWFGEGWIDTAVTWLKGERYQHLFRTEADHQKLADGIAHAIESPTVCDRCEVWGCEIDKDGVCFDCHELDDDLEPAHAT